MALLGPSGALFAEQACLDADFFFSEAIFLFKEDGMSVHSNRVSGLCFVLWEEALRADIGVGTSEVIAVNWQALKT